jgi:hypothetical protein
MYRYRLMGRVESRVSVWTGVSWWWGTPVIRRVGSVVILNCSASCVDSGTSPNVSEVAIRVTRMGGGVNEGNISSSVVSSVISSVSQGEKCPEYFWPVRF